MTETSEVKTSDLQDQINLLQVQVDEMQERQDAFMCGQVKVVTKPAGNTYLYKDGETKIFPGRKVSAALKDGWKDEPTKKKVLKKKA